MGQETTLPGAVTGALEEYGQLLDEHGITWGEPEISYVKWFARRRVLPPALKRRFWELARRKLARSHPGEPLDLLLTRLAEPDYDVLLRDALGGEVPAHLVALRLTGSGPVVDCVPRAVLDRQEERFPAMARSETETALPVKEERFTMLVDSRWDATCTLAVDGAEHVVAPRGAWLTDIDADSTVTVDGIPVHLGGLTRTAAAAALRVRTGFPCRWSVVDADGQGWFPAGAERRHDFHGRPYFHGDDVVLPVPAEPLTVTVTRGMEYGESTVEVKPQVGEERLVELTPRRIYDAAALGWYGGDMHVHLNWAGDVVGRPDDAAKAQHGEDLHVLNLVAGNVSGARVYDREALGEWAGADLPWSDATHLAMMGVEYRNDLLGHVYAFGPLAPPDRFHTGFEGDADWPPNAEGLRELRVLGALLGYSHPYHDPIGDGDPPDRVVWPVPRNCSARELVADAALGLVDSLDVINHASIASTAAVYRRLIGAGNRLAVTAGTDSMISFTRADNQSNPPGWGRVYARVEGRLSAATFTEAVRACRTFATTGPWLELSVEGHGPGAVISACPGDRLTVTATAVGPEVTSVRVRTADGVRAGAERLPAGERWGGEQRSVERWGGERRPVERWGDERWAGAGAGDVRVVGPAADVQARAEEEALSVTVQIEVGQPTYVVAEALCAPHPRTLTDTGYAMTSPVHIDVAGRRVARPADIRWCLDWIDLLEELIKQHARLANRDQLADHQALLRQARTVYQSRLG
ncbi:CehA/McbA family metallohydrolase [Nonomuraea rhizosphaerae]|uniref:CehA/McbA family metallohydrolase n=1 Tax=Nonomuraea rhizosphaerae TaxID=2665663 RepID=UPI001C5CF2E2|nr:CehA/McbA family metallohydrolase [Nonomuraea rhizosphaerae]